MSVVPTVMESLRAVEPRLMVGHFTAAADQFQSLLKPGARILESCYVSGCLPYSSINPPRRWVSMSTHSWPRFIIAPMTFRKPRIITKSVNVKNA